MPTALGRGALFRPAQLRPGAPHRHRVNPFQSPKSGGRLVGHFSIMYVTRAWFGHFVTWESPFFTRSFVPPFDLQNRHFGSVGSRHDLVNTNHDSFIVLSRAISPVRAVTRPLSLKVTSQ